MPSRDLPGLGLKGDWDLGEDLWKVENDANNLWISVLLGGSFSNVLAAEPGAPDEGTIVALDETHATNPNELAVYDEGGWHYRAVPVGTRLWNEVTESYWELGDLAWAESTAATTTYVDNAISAITGGIASLNMVASGCGVVYSGTGLTWNLSAGTYYIDGDLYAANAQSTALDAADGANPRFDALVLDTAGVFDSITGTAAANPSLPAIDSTTHLVLTYVLVPAAAGDLTGEIIDEIIFDEDSEWVSSTSGAGWDAASTNNPTSGTVSLEATAVAAGSYVQFTRASDLTFGSDGNFYFRIRSKAAWNNKRTLSFQFRDANDAAIGSPVLLKHGVLGFDSTITGAHQLIVISKTLFAIEPTALVRALRITAGGSGGAAIGFYADPFVLQTLGGGASNPGGNSGLTQDQADARYVKRAEMVVLTQVEYDAITTPDPDTFYFIPE